MRTAVEILLLICLALLMIAAVAGESRTIVRCLVAVRGPASLNRLGAEFLFTEVMVVALLGLSGGAFPHTAHAVLGAAWLPVGIYFAGWMVRDVGLWLGPVMAGRLRWLTVVGAAVQSLSAVAAVGAVAVSGSVPAGSEPFHAGTPAIAVSALLALSIVAGLRVAWGSRGFEAARFSWPGVRRTSARAGGRKD